MLAFGSYPNRQFINVLSSNTRVPGVVRQGMKAAFRNRIADVELEGVKFRCYPSQNVHDMEIASGVLFDEEREEMEFMLKHLERGGYLVDVGANIGAISIPLAMRAKAPVSVLAIEPNPANVERLRYNATINGLTDFIIAPYAAGPAGKAKLFLHSRSNWGKASLRKVRKSFTSAFIEIECKPLLQILEEAGILSVAVLKIDVEGFEDQALVPFFKTAPEPLWPKAVVIEHALRGIWAEDCIVHMLASGYVVEKQTRMNTMLFKD